MLVCPLDKGVQVGSSSPRAVLGAFLLHPTQGTASSPDSPFPALGTREATAFSL